jgi:putative endonuclease
LLLGMLRRRQLAASTRAVGQAGEAAAVRYLRRRGYVILARNARSRLGELDLVARDGGTLVFVEVKARREGWGDPPAAAVDSRKRARLVRLARGWLAARRLGEQACRFDVLAVSLDARGRVTETRHLPHAFDADGRPG